ncbi:MAG: nucleotide exchange factor GrpE [Oscillospiraceae bacterium]|nr:nucleotide exchange factor GrpE [Oscillospiraceae bacterium]
MSEIEKELPDEEPAAEEISEDNIAENSAEDISEEEEIQEEILEDAAPEEPAEESPEEKIKALEEAAAADKDKYLRLLAEYDNFRKRSVKEKLDASDNATAKAALEVISVIDNFERAVAAECSDENYKKGVEMIYNQFIQVINKLGVEEIDALGKEFDPNLHNAVTQIEDESLGDNVVAQVYQKGYKLGDKVIRCAMVVVANP